MGSKIYVLHLSFLGLGLGEDIPPKEDLQEEHEIACIHKKSKQVDVWICIAGFSVVFVVDSHAYNHQSKHHLGELSQSDVKSIRQHHFASDRAKLGHPIIEIHNSVNRVIHNSKINPVRSSYGVRVPAESQNGDVVVPVQKDWFSL